LERVYCGKGGIKLRVSDPIVDFAESTVWFDNEIENFESFFEDQSPILRQATIPPYNEEEGITFAKNGRMRSVLYGKCAAISIRIVPLSDAIHECFRSKKYTPDDIDCNCEFQLLGRALNCENASPEGVFNELLDSLLVLNSNGSGMIVSSGLRKGLCIRGVIADEVYVPSFGQSSNDTAIADDSDADNITTTVGKEDYEVLRCIVKKVLAVPKRDADASAYDIWMKSIKGSLLAGFEIAMNAGPICEEPVSRYFMRYTNGKKFEILL
jgi:hypothetical protein